MCGVPACHTEDMNTAPQAAPPAAPRPRRRPERADLLLDKLKETGRQGVPIRAEFVQRPPGTKGSRASSLHALRRHERALDAYLLIHAFASASPPYSTRLPIDTWIDLMNLEKETRTTAEAAWSRIARRLVDHQLIVKQLRRGGDVEYSLLHESGNGADYIRPVDAKKDGRWFTLPHLYWTEGHDQQLTHAEKRMLLIALDQPNEFVLPLARVPEWYGVGESAALEGMAGLQRRGFVTSSSEWLPSAKSATGWRQEVTYSMQGAWSLASRTALGKRRSRKELKVT